MLPQVSESTRDVLITNDGQRKRTRAAAMWHEMCQRKAAPGATDEEDKGDKYHLFDLLCIGIGGTVGSGVFVLTGSVVPVAGPSAALSWLFAHG